MNDVLFRMNKRELGFHVLFWILFLGSLLIAWQDNHLTSAIIFCRLCSWVVAIALPIYANALVLIPKYLNKPNWPKYLVLLSGLLLAAKVMHTLFLVLPALSANPGLDFNSAFTRWFFRDFDRLDKSLFSSTFMILALSFAYRIGKDWVENEQTNEKLRSQKSAMELALLKNQMNPHFLFNILNSIYALALEENATKTADNISKLGTLMRYSLHDLQADYISLDKEIAYIEQYIAMQKLRMADHDQVCLNVSLGGIETTTQKIAPMMLMPFIENAFKYGVSTVKKSKIRVEINFWDNTLSLVVENEMHHDPHAIASGLGLKNVENRLHLTYPNGHLIKKEVSDDRYRVQLDIKL